MLFDLHHFSHWVSGLLSLAAAFPIVLRTAVPSGGSPSPGGGGNGGNTDGSPTVTPGSSPGQTGVPGGSPTPGKGAAASDGGGDADRNWNELRTNYETAKRELENYSKLGKVEDLTRAQAYYRAVNAWFGEATQTGRTLGYTDDQIRTSFEDDPIATLSFLRQKAAEGGEGGRGTDGRADSRSATDPKALQRMIDENVRRAIAPISRSILDQRTQAANQVYEGEFSKLVKSTFANEELVDDERSMLYEVATSLMADDEQALVKLRDQGITTDIPKYFKEATTQLDKYYLARSQREARRGRGPIDRPGDKKGPIIPPKWGLDKIANGEFPPGMAERYAPDET